jgi:hypothetical protein
VVENTEFEYIAFRWDKNIETKCLNIKLELILLAGWTK